MKKGIPKGYKFKPRKSPPPRPLEVRLKIGASRKGHEVTEETREKIKKSLMGREYSSERRKNMSINRFGKMRGAENHNWKGGTTPIKKLIRESGKYKMWVKSILERDDYNCQFCFKRGGKLQVDHIIPFSAILEKLKFEQGIDNLYDKAMQYDLFWQVSNGRSLCIDCHRKTDTWGYNKNRKWIDEL